MSKRSIPASDEAWDERELGNDEAFVTVSEDALSNAADEAAGTQLISIRMQKAMIDDLKAIAARYRGIGYQTLAKQILQRFIDGEKKMLWNEYVSQKLKEHNQTSNDDAKPKARTQGRKAA